MFHLILVMDKQGSKIVVKNEYSSVMRRISIQKKRKSHLIFIFLVDAYSKLNYLCNHIHNNYGKNKKTKYFSK